MRIDAHQHFWTYSAEEYGWIADDMAALKQDRLPGDILPLLDAVGLDGTVAVQAGSSPVVIVRSGPQV